MNYAKLSSHGCHLCTTRTQWRGDENWNLNFGCLRIQSEPKSVRYKSANSEKFRRIRNRENRNQQTGKRGGANGWAKWPSRNEFPLLLLGWQYKKCCLKTDKPWNFIFQAKYLHNHTLKPNEPLPKFIPFLSSWRICTLMKGILIAIWPLKAVKFN